MKVSLAQIDVKAGNPEANLIRMKQLITKAKAEKVDIIAFPEMCVGGYLIGDLYLNNEYCRYLMSFNDKIRELSEGITVIYGNVYLLEGLEDTFKHIDFRNNDGRKIRFNAAYIYKDQISVDCGSPYPVLIPRGIQIKSLLPNYRYFDGKRYFMSFPKYCREILKTLSVPMNPFQINVKGKKYKIGIEICEDMWSKDYDFNPTDNFVRSDLIINISSSPWTCGKNDARDRRVKNLVNWNETYSTFDMDSDGNVVKEYKYKSWPVFAYVNCCGSQNNGKNILVFDGASTVYGNDGEPKILANSNYEEELLTFEHNKVPKKTTKRVAEKDIPRKYQAIVRGIQHMSEVSGIKKYVIGTSGGIDSAVVTCLVEQAMGVDSITAINMPSKYNSDMTKNAAYNLSQSLGIKDYRIIPINKIVDAKTESIFAGKEMTQLAQENIQAETRGMILSAISGNEGAFFTNNGNKIETAIGYATLNGDMRGAISPIADLTKEEVYQVGKYLNKEIYKREVIPNDIFEMAPTAELKDDQTDPIKIGYHCKIVEQLMDYKKIGPNQILSWWLSGDLHTKLGITQELMKSFGMDDGQEFLNDLKWFCGRIRSSVFKRVQTPPIITLTKTSFGYDLRESILPVINSGFDRNLEDMILAKKRYNI